MHSELFILEVLLNLYITFEQLKQKFEMKLTNLLIITY